MRPSDRLEKYAGVITIRSSLGRLPVYKVIEKFLKIQDKKGQTIPFILNDDQADLYESMCLQRLRDEPIRIDILKARQKGFSTFIAAVIFVMTIFQPGQRAAIVADIADHASNLFDKYNFFYDNLPEEMQLPKKKSNAKELVVEYPSKETSSVRIMVQGVNAGRSGTYQYLHLSECAFWDDLEGTLVSLLQTVYTGNKDSMVFLETTAQGVNDYKSRWDNDVSGNTTYQAKFYAWFTSKEYRADRLRDYDKPLWLEEYQAKYGLDEFQTLWFYDMYKTLNDDLDLLKQEYPANPVEAFVTSGNSVFNAELLAKRKEEILHKQPLKRGRFMFYKESSLDGNRISVSNIKWIDSRNGEIKIYEEPNPSHPYVIANDPAMSGEDYFASQVFDNYTGKQVAVYHKNKCDADDCAYQTYCLGKYYNDAMITGETNTTSYLLQLIYKCGYKFIYQDTDIEDLGTRYFNKLGYKTKTTNRQYMIDLFQIAFRDNPSIINDYETICEMESFQVVRNKNNNEKAQATGGSHDDLVMSACGFFYCRNAQRCVPLATNEAKKTRDIADLEWERETKMRKKQPERQVYQIWD